MLVGYMRVSTEGDHQVFDLQRDTLLAAGVDTRYPERAVAALREIEDVPQHLLAFLSPLGWEHVNLTGDYIWGSDHEITENTDGMKPLRAQPEVRRKAA